jgi:transcriptional regulator with XRE-family HTH domain
MTMGERLRNWRLKTGLSQDQAAKAVGTNQGTWKAWELGSTPEADYIEAIERLTKGAVSFHGWAKDRRRKRREGATPTESGMDVTATTAKAS